MGRADFCARAGAIFHMAGQTGLRRCQYDNVYLFGVDDNKFGEYVAENFSDGVGLDFLESVFILGGVAYEFVLANWRV